MIEVENDYESVIYEQPFHSNIYENQMELLLDYYSRPRSSKIPTEQEVNGANTFIKPEKEKVPCSSTNHIYQNVQKQLPREKIWTIAFLLESQKKTKNFNHQILK